MNLFFRFYLFSFVSIRLNKKKDMITYYYIVFKTKTVNKNQSKHLYTHHSNTIHHFNINTHIHTFTHLINWFNVNDAQHYKIINACRTEFVLFTLIDRDE